jgi:CHRD domain
MRRYLVLGALIALVSLALSVSAGASGGHDFSARLDGYQEVPAISTRGHGTLQLELEDHTIVYRLSYFGLSSEVLFAHIHFGRVATNGGVSAFLCGGGTAPVCPSQGTVTGTIAMTDVIGPSVQGIDPGEFGELVRAILVRATYANVHTVIFPSGEIRGQIHRG